MKLEKSSIHLLLALFLLMLSIVWMVISGIQELGCFKPNGWFARSGAILVIFAIWTGLLTRPILKDETFPDLVKAYNGVNEDDHWAKKYIGILFFIEIFFAFLGTVIWAYGDLWLPRCT